jgi:hypothetical protein
MLLGSIFGVHIAHWIEVALIVTACLVVPVALAVGIAAMLIELGEQLNKLLERVERLERQVSKLNDAAAPAFATFVSAVGVAISGLVSPWTGAGCAVAVAALTFVFASFAKDPAKSRYQRWLLGLTAAAPYVGMGAFVVGSGRLDGLSVGTLIGLSVAFVIGLVGLTGIVSGVSRASSASASRNGEGGIRTHEAS